MLVTGLTQLRTQLNTIIDLMNDNQFSLFFTSLMIIIYLTKKWYQFHEALWANQSNPLPTAIENNLCNRISMKKRWMKRRKKFHPFHHFFLCLFSFFSWEVLKNWSVDMKSFPFIISSNDFVINTIQSHFEFQCFALVFLCFNIFL